MDSDKLLSKQELCIVDSPAPCSAACPLHVDILSFISEIRKKDFEKAYNVLNKKIPFTRVMCRVCDHPCEDVCNRIKKGGAIQISKLERIAVEYGYTRPNKKLPIPRKHFKIAVIGGGISGLSVATELDKKGYDVIIYEARSYLGGRLWDFDEETLPKALLEEEIQSIYNKKIEIKLDINVGRDLNLDEILEKYDGVYLGTSFWPQELEIDLITFKTQIDKLFAGGCLIKDNNNSVIQSVSTGLRAATSIDRYVNKKSLTAARENEGSYESELKIDLTDITEISPYDLWIDDKYIKDKASDEAYRCIQCKCQECVKACAHLQKFDINPKKYIRQINHNENIVLGNHRANKMINSCTLCGLCGEVCPNGLDMKDIVMETRQSMVKRNKMPPSAHDFALRDMEYNNSHNFKMVRHQPGTNESKYMFFPGCQLSASAAEYVPEVYKYLIGNMNESVGLMLGCCGAPAEWSGRVDMFNGSIKDLKDNWIQMGKPTFILACSTCYYIFKTYIPEIEIVSLWDIMVKFGIPSQNKISNQMILALHDACTTRHDKNIHSSVRRIIEDLGYGIEELKYSKEKTECCGYGGLVYYANREMAEDFIQMRINESTNDYIVYCFMCRDLFASKEKRTLHILDLIYGKDIESLCQRRGPTFSERHENRTRLKIDLLRNLWGEDMTKLDGEKDINIIIPEGLIDIMEDRLILKENIIEVIQYAEGKDRKFINPDNNHSLAYKKIVNVTYWVEYENKEQDFIIHNAYSHRMEILED
ncbi:pyridine nucleotide-disulfide oxidoreductase/dicluster-binding protein [Clostridiisalibacter paucivorans]|uniref:pyridine nucleotide-disulfide oxidoreductase/dicluster-binding protein n=1 Tax=Clostridiisalibacter paucivorans TaxID=408753 RepID=UPI0004791A06|nr:pyridine nucleotide-disulfide oxidoreductase/dicluster-binding protein [Clostridiisalibacter paucivorans]